MNYYRISLNDETKKSWALHEVVEQLSSRPKAEGLAPIFYKFFPASKVEVIMKEQYRVLCCKKCGRYDADKMFEVGFDNPVTLQFKGDFGQTEDRIFAINDSFLKVIKSAKVGGYQTKVLGGSGWHALRVTEFVDHSEGVVKSRKPLCPLCGRPKESFGLFENVRQLSFPTKANTFFTTTASWYRHSSDRDIFITEDVLEALKKGGISGGYCTRLLTDNEVKKQKEKAKEGIDFWNPPGISIKLNGKGK